jgi:hypothetical protein
MSKKINKVLVAVVIILIAYIFMDQTKPAPETSTPLTGEILSGEISTGEMSTGELLTWASLSGGVALSGKQEENITGNIALISNYYKALETHDFALAETLVVSGENTAATLQSKYANAKIFKPYKIEWIGDYKYHFYVIYTKSGAAAEVYSVKKLIVNGKLQSIDGKIIASNTENDYARFYMDEYMQVETAKTSKIKTILTPEYLAASKCAWAPDLASFQKLFQNFTAKDEVIKYTFTFKNTKGTGASLYVITNKMGYKDKASFLKDFTMCYAGPRYIPALINAKYFFLIDGCATEKEDSYCTILQNILKSTLKIK